MANRSRKRGSIGLMVCVGICLVMSLITSSLMLHRLNDEYVKACEVRRLRNMDRESLELIVRESVYELGEAAAVHKSGVTFASVVSQKLTAAGGFGLDGSSYVLTNTPYKPSVLSGNYWGRYPNVVPASILTNGGGSLRVKGVLDAGYIQNVGYGVSFQFRQEVTVNPWEVDVQAWYYLVPVTNWELVAYGLPASGTIPERAPWASGVLDNTFWSLGGRAMVVTSNNPAKDSTSTGDFFTSSTGEETLPDYYRERIALSWYAYEQLWSLEFADYIEGLTGTSLWDGLSLLPQSVVGVAEDASGVIEVDVAGLTCDNLILVCGGGETVRIKGAAAASTDAVSVWVRNYSSTAVSVEFVGDNLRTAAFYGRGAACSFDGHSWTGGLFFSPNSSATGSVTVKGHVSFYGANYDFLKGCSFRILPTSPAAKRVLARVAPQGLIVGTRSLFL